MTPARTIEHGVYPGDSPLGGGRLRTIEYGVYEGCVPRLLLVTVDVHVHHLHTDSAPGDTPRGGVCHLLYLVTFLRD